MEKNGVLLQASLRFDSQEGKCWELDEGNRRVSQRRQLARLLEKINDHDNKDQFLAAKYWIARICEDAGDTAEAVEHYTDVIGVDYDYKDACTRLDALEP